MPFTFSHPSIVLPLRKYFSVTGLVVGSMSPDFEYFIKMRIVNDFGHSFWAVFYFCIPFSLLVSFVFHGFIRESLVANLPYFFQKRFGFFDWNRYFIENKINVLLSIIIGAFSHIIWDSFTHYNGFVVEQFSFFRYVMFEKIQVFKFLQHSGTVLGGIYISYVIYKMPSKNIDRRKIDIRYWMGVLLLSTMILVFRFYNSPILIGNFIVSVISGSFMAVFVVSLISKIKTSPN